MVTLIDTALALKAVVAFRDGEEVPIADVPAHLKALEDACRQVRLRWTPTHRKPFPSDGVCECGNVDWMEVEEGYVRFTRGDLEDAEGEELACVDGEWTKPVAFRLHPDGWDDMSEGGDETFAMCRVCSREYDAPELEVVS